MRSFVLVLCSLTALVGLSACGDDDGASDGGVTTDGGRSIDGGPSTDVGPPFDGGADSTPAPDAGPVTPAAPGANCGCDTECEGTATNAGLCVGGICMMRATGACASGGSSDECPDHLRCWNISEGNPVCWPDSDHFTCAGNTDGDGSCVAGDMNMCDESCSEYCSGGGMGECPMNAHPNTAGDGCVCDEGYVVNAAGNACILPCTAGDDTTCEGDLICNEDSQCVEPPCTAGSCGAGLVCDAPSGACIVELGDGPTGAPPTCAVGTMVDGEAIPDWRCTGTAAFCGEIVQFSPDRSLGVWDYPLNGETDADQYRSFIRRDVMMLVKYSAAMVACQTAGWTGAWDQGNGGALALGDMSEASGDIPGTREGSPGHPMGTHVNGHDMDIGYYQTRAFPNNQLRPICENRDNHCVSPPSTLDAWRTALVLGHFHASPNLRVIGVDGQAGLLINAAMTRLCTQNYLSGSFCAVGTDGRLRNKLAYEVTDMMRGWYRFHHHHFHISVSSPG